jgi:hypothetical protein
MARRPRRASQAVANKLATISGMTTLFTTVQPKLP